MPASRSLPLLGLLALVVGCAVPVEPFQPVPVPEPAAAEAEVNAYYALPPGVARRLGDLDARHPQALSVHFPADGKTMVTSGAGGVRTWDIATRKLLRQYPPESFTGYPLTSTPDGRYFVARGDKDVRVISRADGKTVRKFGAGSVCCFALSPDGKTVATGSWEGELLLWDVETGERRKFRAVHPEVKTPPEPLTLPQTIPQPAIFHVCFSPDGKTVASAAVQEVVRGWDVTTGKELWHFDPKKTTYGPIAFTPDGKYIAVPTIDPRPAEFPNAAGYELWKVADRSRGIALEGKGFGGGSFGAYCIAFSPDGRYFAAGGGDHTLRVWDTKTGKFHFTAPVASSIQEVQFSPDGKTLACVSMGVTLWDVASGKELTGGTGHAGPIAALAVNHNGKRVFTAGAEGTVRAWDATEGKQMWVSPLPARADGPYALSLSPSGKELAVGGRSGSVRILDAATGRELRRVKTPDSMLFAMTYSPDGKMIAVLGGNCTVFLWDAETGKLKGEFVGYDGSGGGGGSALRFSPDGTQLVAPVRRGPGGGGALDFNGKLISQKFDPNAGPGSDPDEKCRLALWDVKTGKRLRILGKPTPHGVNEAVFDLDGATLAVRDYNDVCVIDVATGKERRRFPAAWGYLAFTPDDKLWVGNVCYDPATGKKVAEVAGGPHALAALSDDGRVLVTAQGGSNTALVWYRPER